MNREIKFRAWDNHEKKWLLGYDLPNLGGFSMFGEVMLFNEWAAVVNRFVLQQSDRTDNDLVLMQYTGLKDKNGKEIYEGDIVEWTRKSWIDMDDDENGYRDKTDTSFIEFTEHGFWVKDESFGWEGETLWSWSELNVIGNIYQNPELLKA